MLCFCTFLAILGHFGTKAFKKPVAPAGYKNKQTVSRRRYLARVLSSLMYRYALRQSASVSRFLYPAKGYGDLKTDSLTNFQVSNLLFSKQRAQNASLDDLGTGVDELTLNLGLSAFRCFFLLFLSGFPFLLFLLHSRFLKLCLLLR